MNHLLPYRAKDSIFLHDFGESDHGGSGGAEGRVCTSTGRGMQQSTGCAEVECASHGKDRACGNGAGEGVELGRT